MTEKKQHPHAEFLRAIADGESMDDWECHVIAWSADAWLSVDDEELISIVVYPKDWQVRRKQKTIRIGDMEVPEPMRVAPKNGTMYWITDQFADTPPQCAWFDGAVCDRWLKHGMCHATEQAAEAHRRALILVSGGTP